MEKRCTNEHLCELIRKEQADWALNQLISQNESFICSIANRLFVKQSKSQQTVPYDLDDLIQEGRIAMIKAAEKNDAAENTRFLTFAGRVIHNALLDYIKKMQGEAKDNASLDALPEYEQDRIMALADLYASGVDSTCDPYKHTPEQIYLRKEVLTTLRAALAKCPARNRAYLLYRFGFEDGEMHSRKRTAAHFHLKRSDAIWIEKDGLRQLSAYFRENDQDTPRGLAPRGTVLPGPAAWRGAGAQVGRLRLERGSGAYPA